MNTPTAQAIGPDFSTAAQLDAQAMSWAAGQGFRSVINNRPDFEGGPAQPTSASIQAAAEAAGMNYAFLPVHPAIQTAQDIERMAKLLAELPKPILAFCRTGTRSGKLYHAAKAT